MAIRTESECLRQIVNQKDLLYELNTKKAIHKYKVLKVRIMKYYQDLQNTGCVNIPDFLRDDSPEKLADRELRRLVMNPDGLGEFNRLYELAYKDVAEKVDF